MKKSKAIQLMREKMRTIRLERNEKWGEMYFRYERPEKSGDYDVDDAADCTEKYFEELMKESPFVSIEVRIEEKGTDDLLDYVTVNLKGS